MIKASAKTYTAQVYVGLKEGYNGPVHQYDEVLRWCQEYCDEVGLGVNVQHVDFVYTLGREPGVRVDLIQYPRFPKTPKEIRDHAYSIADLLMTMFKQERCTVIFPDTTYLLEKDNTNATTGPN